MPSNDVARSRRKDPNYIQTSVDLHKALLAKLKSVCVLQGMSLAEALEAGAIKWLESLDEEVPDFDPPAEFEDGRRKS